MHNKNHSNLVILRFKENKILFDFPFSDLTTFHIFSQDILLTIPLILPQLPAFPAQ